MGGIVDSVVKVGTFGLVDDFSGTKAAQTAAGDAASVQAQAASEAEAGINRRYDQTRADLQPQIQAGDLAREQQLKLTGLSGTAAQEAAFNDFAESPAQKFLRERAQKNLLQNAAAIGGVGGGNVRTALVEQGAGFAMQDLDQQYARLAGLAGQGNQATGASATLGANAATSAGNAIMAGGQATAGGILGAQQAQAQGNQQALQLGGLALGAFTGGASLPATSAFNAAMQPQNGSQNINLGLF